jgi:UDP-3-O-[3-hydroxymyristoyl] N-acetylglucosamine deacetylase/3-hydroxyacyl-[acyl-carrier-protein] dehydratase
MVERQHTLRVPVTFEGVGLHTGKHSKVTIRPASSFHGFRFVRTDISGNPVVRADADLVVTTERGTTLEDNGVRIHTTEHLLAALIGSGIDNALIEVDGPEIPILDGSARVFVERMAEAGLQEQSGIREYYEVTEPLHFRDEKRKTEMRAVPSDAYKVSVMVDYNSPVLGIQHAELQTIADFPEQIAPNRTFCFFGELEYLAKNNLIKGGDLDNAVVLVERDNITQQEIREIGALLGKDLGHVQTNGLGVLSASALRFDNEPARHKLLDVVGDLALVGKPIKAHILAERPGHSSNVEFARIIRKSMVKTKKEGKFYDVNKTPLYDINGIMKMLPHRYPFLLVDKIIELDEEGVVGVKNVTMNEPFFQGHFPGNPVFPGVLQVEAMAQCGGIFALHNVEDPEAYSTYFMKIEEVKFKRKVIPGDALVLELKLLTPVRRGIVHMRGTTYVNGQIASEAIMMAQIVKDSRNG